MAVAMQGYTETVEEIDEETLTERIAILLESWGVEQPDDMGDDNGYYEYKRNQAYELASQFPSQISDDLFAEYVEEGLVA